MNAQEFLSLAGKLVASPSASEAACRTAVSRAYYACFHSAKDYLIELGFRMGRNHGLPQRMLMSAGVEASVEPDNFWGICNQSEFGLTMIWRRRGSLTMKSPDTASKLPTNS